MRVNMQISQRGLALIKEFEGLHALRSDGKVHAYLCPAGKPTIGWGCTHGVKLGMIIDRNEAEIMLQRELAVFEERVRKLVTVELNQNQFDALTSFDYNTGALAKSTLLKELNKGRYQSVGAQLRRWTRYHDPKSGERRVAAGLLRRRNAEAALFDEPVAAEVPAATSPVPVAVISAPLGGGAAAPAPSEPIPQAVTTAPPPSVATTVATSRTIQGAALAALGAAGQTITGILGWATDAAHTATGMINQANDAGGQLKDGVTAAQSLVLFFQSNANFVSLGVILIGLAIVVVRRLDAAKNEKVG